MVIEVDVYGEIRKLTLEGLSQRAIVKALGVSRQTVKKYCNGDTIPGNRKNYQRSSVVISPEVIEFIVSCFEEDQSERIVKQRHTAKRIYDRLVAEKQFTGGESTIRRTVNALSAARLVPSQAMMPLSYGPGEALQIDWGEATIYLDGNRIKTQLFCARLCYNCDIFVVAFLAANEEAFLEAQQLAFDHFGGVPRRVIFDNAKVAVKEGFGLYAKPQARYQSFSAHYAFELDFCNPAKGNEKGLVENLVGYSRRNFLVPLPRVADLASLNLQLEKSCKEYRESHRIQGRTQSVREMSSVERSSLHPIPRFRFDISKTVIARTDDFSTVRFDKNNYSVPTKFLRQEITVKGYGSRVVLWQRNTEIATFERIYKTGKTSYRLEHYIDLLERKPRSVGNSRPVKQTVAQELLEWGATLPGGNKDMVKILRLCTDHGQEKILNIKRLIPGGILPTVELIRSYLMPETPIPVLRLRNEVEVDPVDLLVYDRKYGMVAER